MVKFTSYLTKLLIESWLLISLLFVSQMIVFGQVKGKDNNLISKQEIEDESNIPSIGPANCESLRAFLESEILFNNKPNNDSKIIIILRLNKRETANYYNIRRKGLTFWFENYFPKRFVFAKGDVMDAIDDMGRADIYVNGKKSFIIFFQMKNRKICEDGSAG